MSKQGRTLKTTLLCVASSATTLMISQGHLIIREMAKIWPKEDSWEARLETAMWTQGGAVLLGSLFLSIALAIRGWFLRKGKEEAARITRVQKERHEAAAVTRHTELLTALGAITQPAKKLESSG